MRCIGSDCEVGLVAFGGALERESGERRQLRDSAHHSSRMSRPLYAVCPSPLCRLRVCSSAAHLRPSDVELVAFHVPLHHCADDEVLGRRNVLSAHSTELTRPAVSDRCAVTAALTAVLVAAVCRTRFCALSMDSLELAPCFTRPARAATTFCSSLASSPAPSRTTLPLSCSTSPGKTTAPDGWLVSAASGLD